MLGAFELAPGDCGPPCPSWHRAVLLYGSCAALQRIEDGIEACEAAADVDEQRGWVASAVSWRSTAAAMRLQAFELVSAFPDRDGRAAPCEAIPDSMLLAIPGSHGARLAAARRRLYEVDA